MIKLFFILALAIFAFAQEERQHNYEEVSEQKKCARRFSCQYLEIGESEFEHCKAVQACKEGQKGDAEFKSLHTVVSSGLVNFVSIGGGEFDRTEGKIGGFNTKFVLHKLVEYKAANGEEHYDPNTSDICKEYLLIQKTGRRNQAMYKRNTTTGGTEIKRRTITVAKVHDDMPNVEMDLITTNMEAIDQSYVGERKPILSPDAIKINFELSNITYQCPDSTGFAIHALLINKKAAGVKKREGIDNEEKDKEYPDKSSDSQTVMDISDNQHSQGYISWKKEFIKNNNTHVSTMFVGEIEKDVTTEISTCVQGTQNEWCRSARTMLGLGISARIDGLWMSFSGRPEKISYDPTIGMESGSIKFSISIFVVLMICSFYFF